MNYLGHRSRAILSGKHCNFLAKDRNEDQIIMIRHVNTARRASIQFGVNRLADCLHTPSTYTELLYPIAVSLKQNDCNNLFLSNSCHFPPVIPLLFHRYSSGIHTVNCI